MFKEAAQLLPFSEPVINVEVLAFGTERKKKKVLNNKNAHLFKKQKNFVQAKLLRS